MDFKRIVNYPKDKSFFLFGPRGTGKSSWLRQEFKEAVFFDLLESHLQFEFLANPGLLSGRIPKEANDGRIPVVLDEIQKVPALLDEVHRLIENRKIRFILTGSSARKLKREEANLLAGRAITCEMHPFSSLELGNFFSLEKALQFGLLPKAVLESDPVSYLRSYAATYLREEVQQEGLVRSLENFSRFLQFAAFSQGSILNKSKVAQEASLGRRATEGYFDILKDLLLSVELSVFSFRAKRKLLNYNKFFYFDVGVFKSLRPRGPLDSESEINGPGFETLVLQELRALNASLNWNAQIYFWRTQKKEEVDFIIYGGSIFTAIEVKASSYLQSEDYVGLQEFGNDYSQAKLILIYLGERHFFHGRIEVIPAQEWFKRSPQERV